MNALPSKARAMLRCKLGSYMRSRVKARLIANRAVVIWEEARFYLAWFTGGRCAQLVMLLSSFALTACSQNAAQQDVELLSQDSQRPALQSAEPGGEKGEATGQGGCVLSRLDQEILERVNSARALARFCGDSYQAPAAPVAWHCELELAAQAHSEDMARHNFFSHTGSDGLRIAARVGATQYDWGQVGENIAAGYNSAAKVVQAWLDSPSHCQTMMSPRYHDMGVYVALPSGADYADYWTMVMAKAR